MRVTRCTVSVFLTAAIVLHTLTATNAGQPPAETATGAFPFAEYDALLKRYTDADGRVDYAGLKQRDAATIDRLYATLSATGPDKTPELYKGKDAAFSYYLTAYNLLVWKNIIDQIPKLKRVDEGNYAFFHKPQFEVDGKKASLDELEKKVIRPRFQDGRIHFALNCASGGCPKLPRDAFVPAKVQSQLDKEARRFINEKRNVSYDAASQQLKLSMIFKWYKEDFAKDDAGLLAYLNKYRAAGEQLPPGAKIEYVDYDWRMNDPSLPTR